MTCEHCARSIHRAIMEIAGVESAEVDFKKGEAVVAGRAFDIACVQRAVEELGYKFIGSEELE
jgi:copper chaperone CopZ